MSGSCAAAGRRSRVLTFASTARGPAVFGWSQCRPFSCVSAGPLERPPGPCCTCACPCVLHCRPFLDLLHVDSKETRRIWQSAPPHYEYTSSILSDLDTDRPVSLDSLRVLASRESVTEPPQVRCGGPPRCRAWGAVHGGGCSAERGVGTRAVTALCRGERSRHVTADAWLD